MKPFFEHVVAALNEVLQPTERQHWSETTRLDSDLGMDSGLMLELIMQLEESIPGLTIDQATLSSEEFETLGSVCNFVLANRSKDVAL
jgi:acyl carrier protein